MQKYRFVTGDMDLGKKGTVLIEQLTELDKKGRAKWSLTHRKNVVIVDAVDEPTARARARDMIVNGF